MSIMGKRKKKKQKKQKIAVGGFLRQHRSLIIIASLVVFLLVGLWSGYRYIIKNYTVTKIYVDGNIHYTNEQIMDMVMEGRYGNNSLLLSIKYKDKSIQGIPFIEKMDVNILEKDTIRINVYEKAIAGYVEYLGNYLYFDKDGIVVESAHETTAGIPQVIGLDFEYAILHEKLPVKNETVFAKVLSISQLLTKYSVSVDRIFFSDSEEITLYFGDIKVALGNDYHIDEKVMELQNMLPKLEGKSGTLRMENYDEYTKETIFESDL